MHRKLKLLFATKFTVSSKRALQSIQAFQQYYDIEIHLIHVISQFWRSWLSSGLYEKEQMQRLQSWQHRLTPENEQPRQLLIKTDNHPGRTILAEADRLQVDMIAIGGHRKQNTASGTNRIARQIVKRANQTVLLCKSHAYHKVLCGVDGSTSSAKALSTAIRFCRETNTSLSIANVLPRIDFNPLGMPNEDINKREEEFRKAHIREINAFLDQFDYTGIKVDRHIMWGNTARVMLCMVEDFDYDMLVIGATGQSTLSHVVIGSTAEHILVNCPCSLLVVR